MKLSVERGVDQRVGAGVLRPRDGADPPAVEIAQRRDRLLVEGPHRRMLDLVGARQLPGDELGVVDDLDLAGAERFRPAPTPAARARYSATLLVAVPIRSPASASTAPSGAETTTPTAAGPGLPRAPPSTWTTSLRSSVTRVASSGRSPATRARRRSRSWRCPPPVEPRSRRSSRAPIDDHGDVGVLGVVDGELLEQLPGQRLRYDAVDHFSKAIRRGRPRPSDTRPRRAHASSSASVPFSSADALCSRSGAASSSSS